MKVRTDDGVNSGRVLVLCALPYTNAIPHVGNIVGSHLPADIFARYCRLRGRETLFIGGADENGTPTEVASIKLGISPRELTDTLFKVHKQIYEWFNISYDNFSRTSKQIHHKTTQEFFSVVRKNGYVSEGKLKLPYCEHDKIFLPDRYVEGTCPHCGYALARGDQCEQCTRLLDADQLVGPRCKICRNVPTFRESKHLFLELEKLAPLLEKWIKTNRRWRTQVTAIALSWIRGGLKKRCITRDLRWGVPVPSKGYENKVFYVWFDAPIGYLSFTKEWAESKGKPESWRKIWDQEIGKRTKIFNFVGKDNIPFHTIFWPGMQMAHGGLKLPYNVVGLQFCTYLGRKISKSRQWGIFCEKLLNVGLDSDVWRFYLATLIPETKDTDFKWEDFESKVNAGYVGNIGNFIHRTSTFIWNYLNRKLPVIRLDDDPIIRIIYIAKDKIEELFESVRLRDALSEILTLSRKGNQYFQQGKPWELVKGSNADKERCVYVLYVCATLVRSLAIFLSPFIPLIAVKVLKQLNVDTNPKWTDIGKPLSTKEHRINKPQILFERLDKQRIEELKNMVTKMTPLREFLDA
ncbi:MAG: methionine--tRNA ligase [Candidatus Bathyarchaeota archaeon]|nr:methionine--tRNA ligase [Candidatus Bathyarchaeota archaeon]